MCRKPFKCLNCGEEHYSTSRACKVWKKEKEIITIKYREGLSFAEGRKIVDARQALGSYSNVTKSNTSKSVSLKTHKRKQAMHLYKRIQLTNNLQTLPRHKNKPQIRNQKSQFVILVQLNLLKKSSQTAFQRGLMTQYNSITASRVLMKTWRRILTMRNKMQISKVVSSNLIKDESIHSSIVLWYLFISTYSDDKSHSAMELS